MAALVVNSPLLSLAAPNGGCRVFFLGDQHLPKGCSTCAATAEVCPGSRRDLFVPGVSVQAVNPSPSGACQFTWPSQNS